MKPKHCWSGYKREGEVIVHKRNGGIHKKPKCVRK